MLETSTQRGRWWTNLWPLPSRWSPSSKRTLRSRIPGGTQMLLSKIHTISPLASLYPLLRFRIFGLGPTSSSPINTLAFVSGWAAMTRRIVGIAGSWGEATERINSYLDLGNCSKAVDSRHNCRKGSRPLTGRRIETNGSSLEMPWVADTEGGGREYTRFLEVGIC